MLIQILTHTPIYVWAILALLVFRGVVALRDREMAMRKLFIIPLVLLALSLQDIAAKFGANPIALSAWAAGAVAVAAILLVRQTGAATVKPGNSAGMVLVRGSRAPLAMMMTVFFTKYVASVTLAMQPQLAGSGAFVVVTCALFGAANGYFLGGLLRDLPALQVNANPLPQNAKPEL
jgi:hypothetical protein